MRHPDVIIIGAGPAGAAAAIQLRRSRVRFLLLEKERVGGLARTAHLIENYLLMEGGISGNGFAWCLDQHLRSFHIQIRREEVRRVRREGERFLLETREKSFTARALIVASGTKARKARIPGIAKLEEGRVFYESFRIPRGTDPAEIIVLGGGDAAFDYALSLAQREHTVHVLMRSDRPTCLALLEKRAYAQPGIDFMTGVRGLKLAMHEKKIALHGKSPDGAVSLRADYLLPAFGRDPAIDFLPRELRCASGESPAGHSCPGLFFAGDVRHGIYRQAAIASGDGILAAMMVRNFLQGEKS
jgi:thioredoxin reductase (NADPH)